MENITSDSEYFVIPDIPDKIEITKAQTPSSMNGNWKEFVDKMVAAEMATYGLVVNSFEELEPAYEKSYKKARNDKLWCVGPVSLRNRNHLDKAQRGNKVSVDVHNYMKCLIWQQPSGVLYVCLGSICNLTPLQLIELGLRRELLIRGWAPQVLILSHPAIGGFLTHCGWNSTLEAVSAGVPMLTWPLFGDQFFNERFIVQILRVGVRVGVESPVNWGEEDKAGVSSQVINIGEDD
ncbi:UDP-glycosyltransferase family, conserved site [Sesbania bispinosa]|nr:UDP-glycosyltransferase family, conserved site [Sesbania bispinosa]